MKKTLIAAFLIAAAMSASATDVGVSTVRDFTLEKNGAQVTVTNYDFGTIAPQAVVTHINDSYTRYGVGAEYVLGVAGPVSVAVAGRGVYQNTASGVSGYGLAVGVNAAYVVNKKVDVVASIERFSGQERISQFNGNTFSLGVVAKF